MIEHMDRAVRPSIFDVHAEPDLAWTIVLANLMSPFLWELSETVKTRSGEDGDKDHAADELHRFVDSHFTHIQPFDIAEQNGLFDLSEERERLGADVVDGATSKILDVLKYRLHEGTLPARSDVTQLVNDGAFPCYFYATIDEAHAYRRLMGRKKHKPVGVTCCLDEAALIAALICTSRDAVPDRLAIIGSPTHYAAFFAEAGGAWWFNGKHEFFSRADWHSLVAGGTDASGQYEYDARLPGSARILSPLGIYLVADRTSSIPEASLSPILADLTEFFGADIRQIAAANQLETVRYLEPSYAEALGNLFPSGGADSILAAIRDIARRRPDSLEAAALYCFRDLQVPEPRHYLTTAMRSIETRRFEQGISSVDDAIEVVRTVEGTESIFLTRDRLSMPDEVLHFKTGTDRDRALLLYTLLQRSPGVDAEIKGQSEIVFTRECSFVRGPGFLVDADSLDQVGDIDGPVEHNLALS